MIYWLKINVEFRPDLVHGVLKPGSGLKVLIWEDQGAVRIYCQSRPKADNYAIGFGRVLRMGFISSLDLP